MKLTKGRAIACSKRWLPKLCSRKRGSPQRQCISRIQSGILSTRVMARSRRPRSTRRLDGTTRIIIHIHSITQDTVRATMTMGTTIVTNLLTLTISNPVTTTLWSLRQPQLLNKSFPARVTANKVVKYSTPKGKRNQTGKRKTKKLGKANPSACSKKGKRKPCLPKPASHLPPCILVMPKPTSTQMTALSHLPKNTQPPASITTLTVTTTRTDTVKSKVALIRTDTVLSTVAKTPTIIRTTLTTH